jgi:hypothetical protein
VLDVCFPCLISEAGHHKALGDLGKTVANELSAVLMLQSLRGPLSAFKQVEADKRRLQAEGKGKASQSARKSKLKLPAAAQVGGGMKGATKLSRRAAAAKASASAGPYTLERLFF